MSIIDDVENPNVQIRKVNFNIRKLLCMEGYDVVEELRGAAPAVMQIETKPDDPIEKLIAAVLVSIPKDIFERLRKKLFAHITFTIGGVTLTLAGEEERAFQTLVPVHVYELIFRSFYINFIESWDEIKSRFLGDQSITDAMPRPATSHPSSPT